MKYRLMTCLLLVFGLSLYASSMVAAQTSGCMNAAGGPIPCPATPSNEIISGKPGDRDGDGTGDGLDQCPDAGGPASLNGCPETSQTQATAAPALPQDLALPPNNICSVTPASATVNIRSLPSADGTPTATLAVGAFAPVAGIYTNLEGETWYQVTQPNGWVVANVVKLTGNCDFTPTVKTNPGKLSAGAGTPPDECTPNAMCVSPFIINLSNGEPIEGEVETICTTRGICIGTLREPLPMPDCGDLQACFKLLVWTQPTEPPPGGIDLLVIDITSPLPGPDPLPVPLWLGVLTSGVDPTQTREHILLARQVGVPAVQDEETVGVAFDIILDSGDGLEPVGLLLPAVQKIREAANRLKVTTQRLLDFSAAPEPVEPQDLPLGINTEGNTDGVVKRVCTAGGYCLFQFSNPPLNIAYCWYNDQGQVTSCGKGGSRNPSKAY